MQWIIYSLNDVMYSEMGTAICWFIVGCLFMALVDFMIDKLSAEHEKLKAEQYIIKIQDAYKRNEYIKNSINKEEN